MYVVYEIEVTDSLALDEHLRVDRGIWSQNDMFEDKMNADNALVKVFKDVLFREKRFLYQVMKI